MIIEHGRSYAQYHRACLKTHSGRLFLPKRSMNLASVRAFFPIIVQSHSLAMPRQKTCSISTPLVHCPSVFLVLIFSDSIHPSVAVRSAQIQESALYEARKTVQLQERHLTHYFVLFRSEYSIHTATISHKSPTNKVLVFSNQ